MNHKGLVDCWADNLLIISFILASPEHRKPHNQFCCTPGHIASQLHGWLPRSHPEKVLVEIILFQPWSYRLWKATRLQFIFSQNFVFLIICCRSKTCWHVTMYCFFCKTYPPKIGKQEEPILTPYWSPRMTDCLLVERKVATNTPYIYNARGLSASERRHKCMSS